MSNHANTAGRLLIGAIALIHGALLEAQAPPPATGEVITRYLQQDIFIRPGVGFRSVQLGHSFVQVAQVWGEPVGMRRTGFFRSNRIWGYQVGPNTEVLLSGPSRVTTIEVRGTMGSAFQSTEGARFGMTPHAFSYQCRRRHYCKCHNCWRHHPGQDPNLFPRQRSCDA